MPYGNKDLGERIDSGNGSLPDSTKPLLKPMLAWCIDIHLSAISHKFSKICWQIIIET